MAAAASRLALLCAWFHAAPSGGHGKRLQHEYAVKPWDTPETPRPAHWDERTWPEMDHEKMLRRAEQREEERIAAELAKAETAERFETPPEFIARVHKYAPGTYMLYVE